MIKEQLYNKTVQILFDAYHNDTLEHGNCYACAVGNIVAANCGYSFVDGRTAKPKTVWLGRGTKYWNTDFDFDSNATAYLADYDWALERFTTNPNSSTRKQIESTGYSAYELYLIESAFEGVMYSPDGDKHMFDGLCAVLEVLKQIHQISDDEPVRKKFNDHYLTLAK